MRDDFYEIAYKADDDLFLMYLYDWLVKEGRRDQLLEVSRAAVIPWFHCRNQARETKA